MARQNKRTTAEEKMIGLQKFEMVYNLFKNVVDAAKWVGLEEILSEGASFIQQPENY